MSVSLSYSTQEPVTESVRKSVLSAAQLANSGWDWWCESINFFDTPNGDGRLQGDTKLFLIGYTADDGDYVEVDPEEDCIMAWRDAHHILAQLAEWSRQYAVVWELNSEGGSLGFVRDGVIPQEAIATLSDLMEALGVSPEAEDIESRAQQILSQYANRNA
jgi:hypothetical protein